MTLKLKTGMAFEKNILRQPPKKKKRLKLPKIKVSVLELGELIRAFFVSSLVLLNVILLGVAILWFAMILSFIPPVELLDMYGISPSQTAQMVETENEGGLAEIPDAPAISATEID